MLSFSEMRKLQKEFVKTKSGIPVAILFEWGDKDFTIRVFLSLNLCDYLDRMEEYYELHKENESDKFSATNLTMEQIEIRLQQILSKY